MYVNCFLIVIRDVILVRRRRSRLVNAEIRNQPPLPAVDFA